MKNVTGFLRFANGNLAGITMGDVWSWHSLGLVEVANGEPLDCDLIQDFRVTDAGRLAAAAMSAESSQNPPLQKKRPSPVD